MVAAGGAAVASPGMGAALGAAFIVAVLVHALAHICGAHFDPAVTLAFVVLMGCGKDACPAFLGKPLEDWALPDPKHASPAEVRVLRDDIERRVRDLLARHGVRVSGGSGGTRASVR